MRHRRRSTDSRQLALAFTAPVEDDDDPPEPPSFFDHLDIWAMETTGGDTPLRMAGRLVAVAHARAALQSHQRTTR